MQLTGTEYIYMAIEGGLFHKLKSNENHGGILIRRAIGVFTIKTIGVALLFGLNVMLARVLGSYQYGIYVYVFTWINILAVLCLLGFQTSLIRFIAEYNIKQQWSLLLGILKRSWFCVLFFSLLVSLLGFIAVRLQNDRITRELAVTFYVAFCVLPALSIARLRETSLRALKYVIHSELLLRIVRPVLTSVFVIAVFILFDGKLTAPYVVIADLIAFALAAVIGTVLLCRFLPKAVCQCQPEYANRQWFEVSLPLLLIAGMHIILKKTDIVMLGAMKGSQQAGIYAAASNISDTVVFALTAMNSILAPMISELYHTGQKEKLQGIITFATRVVFVFTLIVSIVLIVFGKIVLGLFGSEFVIAYGPLMVLLVGQLVNSLAGSVGFIMSMSGRQNLMGLIVSISAVLNIVLNFILVPRFNLLGAAISTAMTMMMWNLLMLCYVQSKLQINPTIYRKAKKPVV